MNKRGKRDWNKDRIYYEKDKRLKSLINFRGDLLGEGIIRGIDYVITKNPELSGKANLLLKGINREKITGFFEPRYRNLIKESKGGLNPNEFYDLVEDVASYVSDFKTAAFTEQTKKAILKTDLRGDAARPGFWDYIGKREFGEAFKFGKLKAKSKAKKFLEGESYVGRAIDSFSNLYELMKTGDYAQRMPELSKTVNEVYDLGFFDAAADILYQGELLNPRMYKTLKGQIHKRAKEGVEYTQRKLIDYLQYRKIAAVGLGAIGLFSLLMNSTITGNVVGVGSPKVFGLIGGLISLIAGLLLWVVKRR